jgi:hypothetical protein
LYRHREGRQVASVQAQRERCAAIRSQVGGALRQLVVIDVGDADLGSSAPERPRDPPAEPAPGAGD